MRAFVERVRERGVERLTTTPAARRVAGRLHRAASGLAAVTAEVDAYAGLLEEKAGELHDRTRPGKSP
ncbi:hypothetical protein [Nonomuraea typhae]|uniref:hypothetical protein n=1 Tax=Nonomuraea typhae TaxID=2603600 RepID=UPI0012F92B44|nr:hypothetical protein [Nonomuraea typhae]